MDSAKPVRPRRCALSLFSEKDVGFSAAHGGGLAGGTALALGGGQLGDAVAAEDPFEGDAGLFPHLARRTKGGIRDVADPPGRAAGRPDLAVEDLYDVQDRDLLGRHCKAITAVRPAAALQHIGPPELAEDLL